MGSKLNFIIAAFSIGAMAMYFAGPRVRQRDFNRRLDEVEAKILAANVELLGKMREAKEQECRAENARIDAEVQTRVARCLVARSDYAKCIAENERDTAAGAAGCMFGPWGASPVS